MREYYYIVTVLAKPNYLLYKENGKVFYFFEDKSIKEYDVASENCLWIHGGGSNFDFWLKHNIAKKQQKKCFRNLAFLK